MIRSACRETHEGRIAISISLAWQFLDSFVTVFVDRSHSHSLAHSLCQNVIASSLHVYKSVAFQMKRKKEEAVLGEDGRSPAKRIATKRGRYVALLLCIHKFTFCVYHILTVKRRV